MSNRFSINEISNIMLNNSDKYKLNYSHKKDNRWNLWLQDSGMTLSFTLNNNLFIPSISGIKKMTLTKFYSTTLSDIDLWVKSNIDKYLEIVNTYYTILNDDKEYEAYSEYMREYYAEMRDRETACQAYNRINDEYLTEEEYNSAYPQEDIEITKKLIKQFKPKKKKDTQIPGQMSLFDIGGM